MVTQAGISLGPMLVGFALNTILYGVMVTQTLVYFSSYKSDGRWIRLFVTLLLLADTTNVVFEFVYLYDTLITHFGDDSRLSEANWVFSTVPAMTGIISALVQLFFAWRVSILTASTWTVYLIASLAVAGMLCAIGTAIAINAVPVFTQFHRFQVIVIIWLVSAATDNVLITISLVRSLREHRTGFADTDNIIKKIIRLTVHTGLLTAIWTLIDLTAYLALTDGLHLIFNFSLSKFYTNSLLSTLISRSRESHHDDFTVVDGAGQRGADVIQLGSRADTSPSGRESQQFFGPIEVEKLDDPPLTTCNAV
ncbi:hypothetical protein BV22DRAFT_1194460 [Leucogyrophana mollusca]|uniref:Uncharacterized protein n=1 Tax=Leucogyrophana mollusca TaxID=85980 RepID=A0ACB8BMA0_9AGAM|nr:hypothetical protein BV22DRAFT_1194460 [Leucogyrophana mollusca]